MLFLIKERVMYQEIAQADLLEMMPVTKHLRRSMVLRLNLTQIKEKFNMI